MGVAIASGLRSSSELAEPCSPHPAMTVSKGGEIEFAAPHTKLSFRFLARAMRLDIASLRATPGRPTEIRTAISRYKAQSGWLPLSPGDSHVGPERVRRYVAEDTRWCVSGVTLRVYHVSDSLVGSRQLTQDRCGQPGAMLAAGIYRRDARAERRYSCRMSSSSSLEFVSWPLPLSLILRLES